MVLLATHHVAFSQKYDQEVEEHLINQLESTMMTNIKNINKREVAQLEERLISKFSQTLETHDSKYRVNMTFLSVSASYIISLLLELNSLNYHLLRIWMSFCLNYSREK